MCLFGVLGAEGGGLSPEIAKPQTLRRSSQDNVELMTQKEVLNFKPRRDLSRSAINVPSR
jgi:hypothetical protein